MKIADIQLKNSVCQLSCAKAGEIHNETSENLHLFSLKIVRLLTI